MVEFACQNGRESVSTGIIRLLTVGCAVGVLFVAAPAPRAQDAADDPADIAFDSPDASSVLNSGDDAGVLEVTTDDDSAACKYPGGCFTVKGAVHDKTPTNIYGYVEYNTKTCAQISSGEWGQTKAPDHGALADGKFKGHLKSGKCKTHEYTFGELVYTADAKHVPEKDTFKAYWVTADYPSKCPKCLVGLTADVTIEKK
jgi:hypothetical protein